MTAGRAGGREPVVPRADVRPAHHPRDLIVMQGGTTFHSQTDGIESALRQAQAAAGRRTSRSAAGSRPSASTSGSTRSTRRTWWCRRSCLGLRRVAPGGHRPESSRLQGRRAHADRARDPCCAGEGRNGARHARIPRHRRPETLGNTHRRATLRHATQSARPSAGPFKALRLRRRGSGNDRGEVVLEAHRRAQRRPAAAEEAVVVREEGDERRRR